MANTPQAAVATPAEPPPRSDNLALVYQELFTVIARLRANRQRVADPESFRGQILNALKMAEQDALRRGYPQEYVRVATFAVAALLDESILNSQNPVFADWPRKPLNNELFGNNIAGEVFFHNVDRFLGKPDSEPLADLLELHELCLLLGFRGRYGAATAGEIRAIVTRIEEKIRRIRTVPAPKWRIGAETVIAPGDRWIPVLRWIAVGCVLAALILFGIFKFSLSSSASDLKTVSVGKLHDDQSMEEPLPHGRGSVRLS